METKVINARTEERIYFITAIYNEKGKIDREKSTTMRVEYTLRFDDQGRLVSVLNGYGHEINKNSECWSYFSRKYESKPQSL